MLSRVAIGGTGISPIYILVRCKMWVLAKESRTSSCTTHFKYNTRRNHRYFHSYGLTFGLFLALKTASSSVNQNSWNQFCLEVHSIVFLLTYFSKSTWVLQV